VSRICASSAKETSEDVKIPDAPETQSFPAPSNRSEQPRGRRCRAGQRTKATSIVQSVTYALTDWISSIAIWAPPPAGEIRPNTEYLVPDVEIRMILGVLGPYDLNRGRACNCKARFQGGSAAGDENDRDRYRLGSGPLPVDGFADRLGHAERPFRTAASV
jgi:hypothetical protein